MNPSRSYVENLFENIPCNAQQEEFLTLFESAACKVERIVSHGHVTPAGEWYEQQTDEWVAVLKGAARLLFERGGRQVEMKPGDQIFIPAGSRHRVDWTDPEVPTIWLAVHCLSDREQGKRSNR